MNELITKVESFIEKYNIKNTVLVAFSGGVDSMCLLDIINKLKEKFNLTVIAIHLNHNWRGDESIQDENNCKEFCIIKNIEFYCESLDTSIPKTETAAREARYSFFERCSKKFNTNFIFTAHNASDNAETVLYRLIKGTGIIGLEGIQEHRDIFYRPLLTSSRTEIEEYCNNAKLSPNIDSSNNDIKYKRNFIRHEILSKAKHINKNAENAINSLSQIAIENNEIIEEYINKIKLNLYKDKKIITNEFVKLSKAIQNKIIYDIFQENNLDYDSTKINRVRDFIIENYCSKSGKTLALSNDLDIFTNEKTTYILKKSKDTSFEIPINCAGEFITPYGVLSIEECTSSSDYAEDNEYIVYVNADNIDFTLRTRCDGDIIQPLGMLGHQKLKKYLNEKKIAKHEKNKLLFLASKNEILWAIGLGLSEKIKAGQKITHVLKFRKREGENGN